MNIPKAARKAEVLIRQARLLIDKGDFTNARISLYQVTSLFAPMTTRGLSFCGDEILSRVGSILMDCLDLTERCERFHHLSLTRNRRRKKYQKRAKK